MKNKKKLIAVIVSVAVVLIALIFFKTFPCPLANFCKMRYNISVRNLSKVKGKQKWTKEREKR